MVGTKDPALDTVEAALRKISNLDVLLGQAIRQGIDEVIQGPRTGRWSIEEIEKTEKAYIGTRIEILVRAILQVPRGRELDYVIAGHEVDAKFSIRYGGWMIPQEAIGKLCLLLACNDEKHKYWAGLIRATPAVLTKGKNQDQKGSISKDGRAEIRWLANAGSMPTNFFMHDVSKENRTAIFSKPPGQPRVNELFRIFPGTAIPGTAIISAATGDENAASRVAAAAQEIPSFQILSGDVEEHRALALRRGILLEVGCYTAIPK